MIGVGGTVFGITAEGIARRDFVLRNLSASHFTVNLDTGEIIAHHRELKVDLRRLKRGHYVIERLVRFKP